jgi:hypothetical protein
MHLVRTVVGVTLASAVIAGSAGAAPRDPAMPGTRPPVPVSGPTIIPPRRGRSLVAGVAVSGSAILLGAVFVLIPLTVPTHPDDDTSVIGLWFAGWPLVTLGSVSTLVTASYLGHHRRWDLRSPVVHDGPTAARAKQQRRRLRDTLIVGGATTVAGALAIGLGLGLASRCGDESCSRNRWVPGIGVGAPLMLGGLFTMLSAGILRRVHENHRHRDASEPRVTPGFGGLSLRF